MTAVNADEYKTWHSRRKLVQVSDPYFVKGSWSEPLDSETMRGHVFTYQARRPVMEDRYAYSEPWLFERLGFLIDAYGAADEIDPDPAYWSVKIEVAIATTKGGKRLATETFTFTQVAYPEEFALNQIAQAETARILAVGPPSTLDPDDVIRIRR